MDDAKEQPAKPKRVLVKRTSSIGFAFVVPDVTKMLLARTTWHKFGSGVYAKTKTAAKSAGLDPDDATAAARHYYRVAGDKWVAAGGLKSSSIQKRPAMAQKTTKKPACASKHVKAVKA